MINAERYVINSFIYYDEAVKVLKSSSYIETTYIYNILLTKYTPIPFEKLEIHLKKLVHCKVIIEIMKV